MQKLTLSQRKHQIQSTLNTNMMPQSNKKQFVVNVEAAKGVLSSHWHIISTYNWFGEQVGESRRYRAKLAFILNPVSGRLKSLSPLHILLLTLLWPQSTYMCFLAANAPVDCHCWAGNIQIKRVYQSFFFLLTITAVCHKTIKISWRC